ncbi:coiled-coil domain-containing protein 178 isoform X2 [Hyla sarda]|uniref:coiled-coil domain-containing protein 178 isoform X2 n=1 Tax=Hyla sarda TaxID=327740 RepID=UPI0024C44F44|nr:coiled-coil domain-containing protein 178 isoform X2 [Hyla sarda]
MRSIYMCDMQRPLAVPLCTNTSMASTDTLRRRSCELVNTPLPCVNKALSHIDKLEEKIKVCFLQHEDLQQKQKKFVKWISCVSSEDTIRAAQVEIPTLHVKGIGITDKDFSEQGGDSSLKLDTDAVISEVLQLIWRLEADRQEAEEALKLEKERKGRLITQIDALSQWKLYNFPEAVQKEYEASAQDLSELQWHISCKKQELEKALDLMAKTEAVKTRHEEKIDFIKKHRPLLDDKLHLEGDAMSRIKMAQAEATILLNEAEIKRKSAQMSFEKVTEEANQERNNMAAKLADIKKNLQFCRDHLSNSEKTWAEYSADLLNTDIQIEDGRKLYSNLLHEKQQLIDSENSWNQQVNDVKYELDDQEKKYKDLSNTHSKHSQEAEIQKSDFQTQLSHLEQQLHKKLHALRDLEYENRTLDLENEDTAIKTANSHKTKSKLEADIKRMQKSQLRNEEQSNNTTKELSHVSVSHAASKKKLSELEARSAKEESRLKNLADTMRKQIIEEVKTAQLTQARIKALIAERHQKQKDYDKMKEELVKAVEEIELPVAALEAEIVKLTNRHAKKAEELKNIKQQKTQCDEEFTLTSQQLTHQRNDLLHQLKDTEVKMSVVSEELKKTIERTENFQKLTRDLIQYGNVIDKAIKSTENAIAKLQQNYNLQELKLKDLKAMSGHLLQEIEMYTQRMKTEDEDSVVQLQIRQKMQAQSSKALDTALKENVALAKEYQILQTSFLDEKDKLMVNYEKRIKMETTRRDYLQISVLQSRMHRALVEFFKQRGLYNQAGLARFQAASQENAHKILAVQEEMSKTIQHVSAFLTSLTDGSPREDDNENKQSISHAETKDRQSHTVHITV